MISDDFEVFVTVSRILLKTDRLLFLFQSSEARALYNLGSVYHAKGKQAGRSTNQDPGNFPSDVIECLIKATEYYE